VPKPNTMFELSVDDMEMIESALLKSRSKDHFDVRKIHDLLGRLHNQKNFYRPNGAYLSG
jgi:hypothetical protein